jgi:hypothetical protein
MSFISSAPQIGNVSREKCAKITYSVGEALIVWRFVLVGQVVAMATRKNAMPCRKIQPPHQSSADAQKPEPLPSKTRANCRHGYQLLIDGRTDIGELTADKDRQSGRSAMIDAALKVT